MSEKICPIITKLDQQEKTEEFITYKLIRQPCLKEKCALWVVPKFPMATDIDKQQIEALSHCGLIN